MLKRLIIISISFIFLFNIKVFSDCPLEDCEGGQSPPLTYAFYNPICQASCVYHVYYRLCLGTGSFVIDSVMADTNNVPCCAGTATNSPVITADILREAGRTMAMSAGLVTYSIYLPSKCWKWEGTL